MSGRAAPRKSRRRRQYLVRPPQSRDLGPQTPQLRHRVFGRLLGLRRDRGVRLVAPTAQRLRRDPQILGDLFDRLGLRRIRAARLGQQPDGLRLELRRVSRSFCHGSIISHRVRGNAEQKSVHISSGWSRWCGGRSGARIRGLVRRGPGPGTSACVPRCPSGAVHRREARRNAWPALRHVLPADRAGRPEGRRQGHGVHWREHDRHAPRGRGPHRHRLTVLDMKRLRMDVTAYHGTRRPEKRRNGKTPRMRRRRACAA